MQTNTTYQNKIIQNPQSGFSNISQEQSFIEKSLASLLMTDNVKIAFEGALNSLSKSDKLIALSLTLDLAKLSITLDNGVYEPTLMDYNYLKNGIDSFLNPSNGTYISEETKEGMGNFWRSFENIYNANTKNSSTQSDADVAQFLSSLRTKGAAKFLADLNKEKIEKMVNEYKQKLLDKMGDSPEAMQEIARMITDYKKQLLEELQNSLDNDDKKTLPINANSIAQLLVSTQEKQTKPLEELLKLKN